MAKAYWITCYREILDPRKLAAYAKLAGPAIVEQPDTTLVLYPEQRAVVEESGNLIVAVPARSDKVLSAAVAS